MRTLSVELGTAGSVWERIILVRQDRSYRSAGVAPGSTNGIRRIGGKICIAGVAKRAEIRKQWHAIGVDGPRE
jgi:phage gp45-like